MKPVALNPVAAYVPPMPQGGMPMQDQAIPSFHRLQDVKLDPPYKQKDIDAYLQARQVRGTGDLTFDACLFQSVLFTDFFAKIETGEIKPGQPEHDRPAQYLLKKSVELLQPLGIRMDQERQFYDKLLLCDSLPPEGRDTLTKQFRHFQNMIAKFGAIERNLLDVYSKPGSFSPTRDKACLLLFVHALLADAVTEMSWLTDHVASNKPHTPWCMPIVGEAETLRAYLECEANHCDLFSPGPLTQADAAFYKHCLAIDTDGAEAVTVPSFSRTGSQGVLAILHAIFNRQHLLSGAISVPYNVHNDFYRQRHFSTLCHDCEHLDVLLEEKVLMLEEKGPSIAQKFEPIYQKLKDPQSTMNPLQVKDDLVVLFFMLHENSLLMRKLNGSLADDVLFQDLAWSYFHTDFELTDTIKLLNGLDFTIDPLGETNTEEIEGRRLAATGAMNELWEGFRARHEVELKASGLFDNMSKFLADKR